MNIKEIQQEKAELERQIKSEIMRFEKRTGLEVDSLDFKKAEYYYYFPFLMGQRERGEQLKAVISDMSVSVDVKI